MKRSLVFATGNRHKLEEVQGLLGKDFALSCLKDVGITEDVPETSDTLEGNALQKARYVYARCHCACFSDDTGLEVEALNGAPGVYSARYAGDHPSFEANMDLLLHNLKGKENRKAQFRTVIAYINEQGEEFTFEGSVQGKIVDTKTGTQGFGYDPIFVPDGYTRSFAEFDLAEKNAISHRGRALQKFIQFLQL